MTTSVKTCFKCGTEKPLTEFYKHAQMGDGHLNKCKECTKLDVSKNYRDNVEHYRNYDRERFTQPGRKAQLKTYHQRRRKKYPERYAAHVAVCNAVRDGRLTRPDTCTKCGSTTKIQGHHPDYSKPLDVVWLCYRCHMNEHGKIAA